MSNKTRVIKVFEAFAGIGAQRKALKLSKIKYKIIGLAEWYVDAIFSYQAIHNKFSINKSDSNVPFDKMIEYLSSKPLSIDSKTLVDKNYWKKQKKEKLVIIYKAIKMSEDEGNIFDVRLLYKRTLKNIDLLTYSFPCQDLSQQGKQKGMSKKDNSHSSLLWEIDKALDATDKSDLPQFLLMENVKAICNKKNHNELQEWQDKLTSLGYVNDLKVLNASHFGGSQARERVFMLSTLNSITKLPQGTKKPQPIKKILNKKVLPKDILKNLEHYQLSKPKVTKLNIKRSKLIDYTSFNSESYVYYPNFTGPTLTASGANSRIKIKYKNKIRKLNGKEAYKYMGFEATDFNKVDKNNFLNDNKIIYTAGNSIPVKMIVAVMAKIKMKWENDC